jgi:uncharacterized protein YdaU (DUF1376 family)
VEVVLIVHYYEHNVGDYRKDTAHLSLLEHGIYRQLLDTYYLDEHPLTLDHAKLMRSHSVRNADEMRALENVLADFFDRTENGYVHKRCEVVINAYKAKSASAKKSAEARWAKERCDSNADGMRSHSDGNANHKPITNNHKPVKAVERASRLSKDWTPDPTEIEFCRTERPDLDVCSVVEQFRDYWVAKAGKDGAKLDWPATWRNWVRRQQGQNGSARASPIDIRNERRRHAYEVLTGQSSGASSEPSDGSVIDIQATRIG